MNRDEGGYKFSCLLVYSSLATKEAGVHSFSEIEGSPHILSLETAFKYSS